MAFIQCNFFASSLGMCVSANVVLPQGAGAGQIGGGGSAVQRRRTPVLYLLHGLSDDHTIWMRRTSIERYADRFGIAVVMPCGNRSFYTNNLDGMRFWDYISEELPARMVEFFNISDRREDTFAAGLSMGGYGALRLGLKRPDRFAAVAGLSAAIDMDKIVPQVLGPANCRNCFGDGPLSGNDFDPFFLAEKAKESGIVLPEIFLACGTEDFLYPANLRFHEELQRLGYDHNWISAPGNHTWEFWDEQILAVLDWLPLKQADSRDA